MDHIEVSGGRLAYRVHGDGQPVVLLHPGFVADGMVPFADQAASSSSRARTNGLGPNRLVGLQDGLLHGLRDLIKG